MNSCKMINKGRYPRYKKTPYICYKQYQKKYSKNMFVIRNLCQHSLSFFKQVLCLFCQHSIQLSCIILRRKNVTSDWKVNPTTPHFMAKLHFSYPNQYMNINIFFTFVWILSVNSFLTNVYAWFTFFTGMKMKFIVLRSV